MKKLIGITKLESGRKPAAPKPKKTFVWVEKKPGIHILKGDK